MSNETKTEIIDDLIDEFNECEMPVLSINYVDFVDYSVPNPREDEAIYLMYRWILKLTKRNVHNRNYLEIRGGRSGNDNDSDDEDVEYLKLPIVAVIPYDKITVISWQDVDGSEVEEEF